MYFLIANFSWGEATVANWSILQSPLQSTDIPQKYNERFERENSNWWWPKVVCVEFLLFLKHTSDKKDKYGLMSPKTLFYENDVSDRNDLPLWRWGLMSDTLETLDIIGPKQRTAATATSKWNNLFIYESKEDFSKKVSIADEEDNVFSGSYNFVDNPGSHIFAPTFNTSAQSMKQMSKRVE